jgi:predicted DCC family thiol-disulfide oxidoreductase YuxK
MKKAKKRARPNTSTTQPAMPLLRRGFAANSEERDILLAWGLDPLEVYTIGDGAETFEQMDSSFRAPPRQQGELVLVSDLRILGDSKKAINKVLADLHDRKIAIRRLYPDKEVTNPHILTDEAFAALANNRFQVRGRAKRWGKKGGAAKGFHEKGRRDARIAEDIVRKLVIRDGIRKTAALLGKPFSRGVLTRHYQ